MRRDGIAGWQREFYSGPQVWWVRDPDGWPSNFYDSPEAAQVELDFRARNGERGYSMCSEPVHTLKLSRERWLDPVSVTQPGGVQ